MARRRQIMKRLIGILAMTLVTTLPARAAQPERDPQELAQVRQRLREVETTSL